MRLTLIALLLAGVAGCGSEPVDNTQRSVEEPKLETGNGGKEEPASKLEATLKAAQLGIAGAQSSLGWAYSRGEGVPKDKAEAVKWWRKAAEQGEAFAQYNLGLSYRNGCGVPEDDAEAVKWFSKAAERGIVVAQYNLGAIYAMGEGVPENYVEAYAWWSVAATNGDEFAKRVLPKGKAKLTPEQLIAAEKRIEELTEEINANKAK